jgi:hypothetical protein
MENHSEPLILSGMEIVTGIENKQTVSYISIINN